MVTCNLAKVDMRVRFSLPAPLGYNMEKTDLHFFPTLVRKIKNFISEKEIKAIINDSKNIEFNKHDLLDGNSNSSHSNSLKEDSKKILSQLITNDLVIDRLNLVNDNHKKPSEISG